MFELGEIFLSGVLQRKNVIFCYVGNSFTHITLIKLGSDFISIRYVYL